MLDFFSMVANFFTTIWDFVSTAIESLITLISVVALSTTLPSVLVGMVPTFIGSTILAVVSIAVVKLIVGRQ